MDDVSSLTMMQIDLVSGIPGRLEQIVARETLGGRNRTRSVKRPDSCHSVTIAIVSLRVHSLLYNGRRGEFTTSLTLTPSFSAFFRRVFFCI